MKNRHDSFLREYNFYTNSIEFRISSSKALERWKNVQSFQLNQLVNGRFYFSSEEREIILLSYDLWSKWLYEIENYCIQISGDATTVTSTDIDFVSNLAYQVERKFKFVTIQNSESFDSKLTEIWSKQHKMLQCHFQNEINETGDITIIDLFNRCVVLITEIMQHELIAIHELSNLFKGSTPFPIVVNELSCKDSKTCFIVERLKIYLEYFDIKEVFIKNLTDNPIDSVIAQKIEETGLIINYKLSSRFDV